MTTAVSAARDEGVDRFGHGQRQIAVSSTGPPLRGGSRGTGARGCEGTVRSGPIIRDAEGGSRSRTLGEPSLRIVKDAAVCLSSTASEAATNRVMIPSQSVARLPQQHPESIQEDLVDQLSAAQGAFDTHQSYSDRWSNADHMAYLQTLEEHFTAKLYQRHYCEEEVCGAKPVPWRPWGSRLEEVYSERETVAYKRPLEGKNLDRSPVKDAVTVNPEVLRRRFGGGKERGEGDEDSLSLVSAVTVASGGQGIFSAASIPAPSSLAALPRVLPWVAANPPSLSPLALHPSVPPPVTSMDTYLLRPPFHPCSGLTPLLPLSGTHVPFSFGELEKPLPAMISSSCSRQMSGATGASLERQSSTSCLLDVSPAAVLAVLPAGTSAVVADGSGGSEQGQRKASVEAVRERSAVISRLLARKAAERKPSQQSDSEPSNSCLTGIRPAGTPAAMVRNESVNFLAFNEGMPGQTASKVLDAAVPDATLAPTDRPDNTFPSPVASVLPHLTWSVAGSFPVTEHVYMNAEQRKLCATRSDLSCQSPPSSESDRPVAAAGPSDLTQSQALLPEGRITTAQLTLERSADGGSSLLARHLWSPIPHRAAAAAEEAKATDGGVHSQGQDLGAADRVDVSLKSLPFSRVGEEGGERRQVAGDRKDFRGSIEQEESGAVIADAGEVGDKGIGLLAGGVGGPMDEAQREDRNAGATGMKAIYPEMTHFHIAGESCEEAPADAPEAWREGAMAVDGQVKVEKQERIEVCPLGIREPDALPTIAEVVADDVAETIAEVDVGLAGVSEEMDGKREPNGDGAVAVSSSQSKGGEMDRQPIVEGEVTGAATDHEVQLHLTTVVHEVAHSGVKRHTCDNSKGAESIRRLSGRANSCPSSLYYHRARTSSACWEGGNGGSRGGTARRASSTLTRRRHQNSSSTRAHHADSRRHATSTPLSWFKAGRKSAEVAAEKRWMEHFSANGGPHGHAQGHHCLKRATDRISCQCGEASKDERGVHAAGRDIPWIERFVGRERKKRSEGAKGGSEIYFVVEDGEEEERQQKKGHRAPPPGWLTFKRKKAEALEMVELEEELQQQYVEEQQEQQQQQLRQKRQHPLQQQHHVLHQQYQKQLKDEDVLLDNPAPVDLQQSAQAGERKAQQKQHVLRLQYLTQQMLQEQQALVGLQQTQEAAAAAEFPYRVDATATAAAAAGTADSQQGVPQHEQGTGQDMKESLPQPQLKKLLSVPQTQQQQLLQEQPFHHQHLQEFQARSQQQQQLKAQQQESQNRKFPQLLTQPYHEHKQSLSLQILRPPLLSAAASSGEADGASCAPAATANGKRPRCLSSNQTPSLAAFHVEAPTTVHEDLTGCLHHYHHHHHHFLFKLHPDLPPSAAAAEAVSAADAAVATVVAIPPI